MLASLSLSAEHFADLCVLLGNDACPRISGVGPVASFRLIQQHGSIEAILASEQKVREKVPDVEVYLAQVRAARKVFADLPPITSQVREELVTAFEVMKRNEVDYPSVERWLVERHAIRFVDAGSEETPEIDL